MNFNREGRKKLELRVLKYFLTVAQEGTITRAADILHVTQPTLSRQLKQLEDDLGTALMIRTNSQIALTEAGLLLEQRAKEILELSDRTAHELRHQRSSFGGTVSIGSASVFPSTYVSKIIKKYRDNYPDNEFYLYTSCAENIKERVDKGLSAVALVSEPVESSKYDYVILAQEWHWSLFVPKDAPAAQREYISIDELADMPLIIPKRVLIPPAHDELLAFLYENDIPISGSYNLNTNAQALVKDGLGYALGLYSDACWLSEGITVVPVRPHTPVHCALVWKKGAALNLASQRFIDTVTEHFAL